MSTTPPGNRQNRFRLYWLILALLGIVVLALVFPISSRKQAQVIPGIGIVSDEYAVASEQASPAVDRGSRESFGVESEEMGFTLSATSTVPPATQPMLIENFSGAVIPVRDDSHSVSFFLQILQHIRGKRVGKPRIDLGPDPPLPALEEATQIEAQSQMVLDHTEVPGHVVTSVSAEEAGIIAHEGFVHEVEDPLQFARVGIEIELPQSLKKRLFPVEVQQGVAEIEP